MALFNIGGPTTVAPVIEFPGKIYIFGQAHDASSLTPIFGEFLRGVNDPYSSGVAGYVGKELIGVANASLADVKPRNQTGLYNFVLRHLASTGAYLRSSVPVGDGQYLAFPKGKRGIGEVIKYDADGSIISSALVNSTDVAVFMEDELNVYCVGTSTAAVGSSQNVIFTVNKNSLAVTPIQSTVAPTTVSSSSITDAIAYPINSDSSGVYLFYCEFRGTGNSSGSPNSFQFNNARMANATIFKISNGGIVTKGASLGITTLGLTGQSNGASFNDGSVVSKYADTADEIKCLFIGTSSSSAPCTPVGKITVNKNTLAITVGTVKNALIESTDALSNWYTLSSNSQVRAHCAIHNLKTDANGKVKFMATSYQNIFVGTSAGNTGTSTTLTIEYSPDTEESKVVSHFHHRPNSGCTGLLPLNAERDQYFVSYGVDGGDFVQLNPLTHSFILKSSLEFPVVGCFVDQVGRLWAQDDLTGSIHMFGPTTSATLRVSFQDKNLKFEGSQINSAIAVSAFNHMGERVSNNVRLTLDGNSAVFADGSNSTTITTDAGSDLMVPIKIIGNGFVRVAASLAV